MEEVDTSCTSEFMATLLSDKDLSSPVVVDMGKVSFIDSTGLQCLVTATHQRRSAGGEIVLANSTRTVSRLIRLTGVDRILDNYPSVEYARMVLGAGIR